MGNLGTEGTSRRKLVQCKACNGEISRKAHVCPHCGHSKTRWVLCVVVALGFMWTLFHEEIHDAVHISERIDEMLHFLGALFGAG